MAPHLTSGLGNRLFQYAAAAGAAESWKRELVFYMPKCDVSPHGPIASIFRMFPHIPRIEEEAPFVERKEPARGFYQYIPLGSPPDTNVCIDGFRQSPLYFPSDIRPHWNNALGPSVQKRIEKLSNLETIQERNSTYAIHIRLGDYKYLKHHQVDLSKYYKRALERVPSGSRLHIFSDEPDACHHLFSSIKDLRITMAVTRSDVESLYEMTLCLGGTITANSTFSWWGAWFAHDAGAAWATYPSSMGVGQPEPNDFFPEWGTIIQV